MMIEPPPIGKVRILSGSWVDGIKNAGIVMGKWFHEDYDAIPFTKIFSSTPRFPCVIAHAVGKKGSMTTSRYYMILHYLYYHVIYIY